MHADVLIYESESVPQKLIYTKHQKLDYKYKQTTTLKF